MIPDDDALVLRDPTQKKMEPKLSRFEFLRIDIFIFAVGASTRIYRDCLHRD